MMNGTSPTTTTASTTNAIATAAVLAGGSYIRVHFPSSSASAPHDVRRICVGAVSALDPFSDIARSAEGHLFLRVQDGVSVSEQDLQTIMDELRRDGAGDPEVVSGSVGHGGGFVQDTVSQRSIGGVLTN